MAEVNTTVRFSSQGSNSNNILKLTTDQNEVVGKISRTLIGIRDGNIDPVIEEQSIRQLAYQADQLPEPTTQHIRSGNIFDNIADLLRYLTRGIHSEYNQQLVTPFIKLFDKLQITIIDDAKKANAGVTRESLSKLFSPIEESFS
ncbi:MAG: hypothetical protein O3C63_04820 [Cyanobacteria bacterium]|nr:hypothetical protein [Cyanobacteriota bacterium]